MKPRKYHSWNFNEMKKRIAREMRLLPEEIHQIINLLTEEIVQAIEAGKFVNLPGFGKFEPRDIEARKYVNNMCGGTIYCPKRRRIKFRLNHKVKDRLYGIDEEENSGIREED